MTRSAGLRVRAAINATTAAKPPSKRNESKRPTPNYSTRELDWEEQRTLPKRFWENGPGVWPVDRIIDQKGRGKQVKYLVEWEPHPTTGEFWDPAWVSASFFVSDTPNNISTEVASRCEGGGHRLAGRMGRAATN
jgi:hypothetical protein